MRLHALHKMCEPCAVGRWVCVSKKTERAMSNPISADPQNADQIAYWNGPAGERWAQRQEEQDTVLAPVLAATVAKAAVRANERVIDVGCGAGASTIELGRRVGPTGHVLGIDVSAPMLARAATRIEPGLPVEFQQADMTTYEFVRADYDLAFSRFGVMFFADPTHSFANLRKGLRSGGRLIFACWRAPEENQWVALPMRVAAQHVPTPPMPGLDIPGLFSLSDGTRVRQILGAAGFESIRLDPQHFEFDIARGQGLDAGVVSAMTIGPASRSVQDQPQEVVDKVRASMHEALAPHQRGQKVPLSAGIWIVTATKP